jgi:hypothetical protein
MLSKISTKFATILRTVDIRMILFLLLLVLFVLGAGAPGATGLNTG